jgi:hypothetical protein
LPPHSETRIVYGANFENQVPIIASLPLQIVNEGKKTLRNGSITIRYPQNSMMLSEAELPLKGAGILDENIPKRTTSELPQFKFASWFIKDLNPKILFGIGESFRLNETTQIRTFLDYKTNQWMREEIEYTLSLLVTVSAEDIEAQDYILLFKSIKSSDIDDLINKYYLKVNNQSQRVRKSMSFIDYLILYFHQPVEDATFIYITKDNKVYQKVVSRYRFPLTF